MLFRASTGFAPLRAQAWVVLALLVCGTPPTTADEVALSETITEIEGLVGNERCEEALFKLDQLREEHPEDPDLMVLEGNCLVRQAETSSQEFDRKAYERLRRAYGEKRMPQELTSLFYRVQRTFDQDLLAEGLDRFRRAVRTAPERGDLIVGTAAVLIHADRLDEALELLRKHRDVLTDDHVMELAQVIEDRLSERRLAIAARLGEELSAMFPEHPAPWIARGRLALSRHRALEAIDHFAKARELAPYNQGVASELNRLRLLAGRFDAAVKGLVPLTDRSSMFRVWLALARSVENPASAARLWKDLAERGEDPTLDESTQKLIRHYVRLLGGDQLPPPQMRLRGARMLADRGLNLPAVIEARAAVTAEPDLVEGWVLLSRIFRRELLFDLAVNALDHAIDTTKGLPEASRPFRPDELDAWRAEARLGLGESGSGVK